MRIRTFLPPTTLIVGDICLLITPGVFKYLRDLVPTFPLRMPWSCCCCVIQGKATSTSVLMQFLNGGHEQLDEKSGNDRENVVCCILLYSVSLILFLNCWTYRSPVKLSAWYHRCGCLLDVASDWTCQRKLLTLSSEAKKRFGLANNTFRFFFKLNLKTL